MVNAVDAKVVDMADMKHRVAATEAMISAAAQNGQERNARLLNFLERVEQNLVQKQEQIDRLELQQSQYHEENQLLRTLLHDMLSMAETTLERGSRVAADDLQLVIDRLGTIASMAKQEAEAGTSSVSAKEPDSPPADSAKEGDETPATGAKEAAAPPGRKRGVSKVLSLFGSPLS